MENSTKSVNIKFPINGIILNMSSFLSWAFMVMRNNPNINLSWELFWKPKIKTVIPYQSDNHNR